MKTGLLLFIKTVEVSAHAANGCFEKTPKVHVNAKPTERHALKLSLFVKLETQPDTNLDCFVQKQSDNLLHKVAKFSFP